MYKKIAKKKVLVTLEVILIIGMLASLYLLYEHFSPSASKFCNFGKAFDCGIVNKSPYANLDGISYLLTIDFELPLPLINISGLGFIFDFLTANAFLGFLMFLLLFFLLKAHTTNNIKLAHGLLLFSLIYGFYLFLIQHFILKTYCIICLLLDAIIIASLILVWRIKK